MISEHRPFLRTIHRHQRRKVSGLICGIVREIKTFGLAHSLRDQPSQSTQKLTKRATRGEGVI